MYCVLINSIMATLVSCSIIPFEEMFISPPRLSRWAFLQRALGTNLMWYLQPPGRAAPPRWHLRTSFVQAGTKGALPAPQNDPLPPSCVQDSAQKQGGIRKTHSQVEPEFTAWYCTMLQLPQRLPLFIRRDIRGVGMLQRDCCSLERLQVGGQWWEVYL